MKETEVLIIDEVFLSHASWLQFLSDEMCRVKNHWASPFGGACVIMAGDRAQMIPIVDAEDVGGDMEIVAEDRGTGEVTTFAPTEFDVHVDRFLERMARVDEHELSAVYSPRFRNNRAWGQYLWEVRQGHRKSIDLRDFHVVNPYRVRAFAWRVCQRWWTQRHTV